MTGTMGSTTEIAFASLPSGQVRLATSCTAASLQGEPSTANRILITSSLCRELLTCAGRQSLFLIGRLLPGPRRAVSSTNRYLLFLVGQWLLCKRTEFFLLAA